MAKIRSKIGFKKFAGKCAFCNETNYAVLEVHRIYEGHRGGVYDTINCVCVCANHHRMIHDNQLVVVKKHISYGSSLYSLEYVENKETKYLSLNY